MAEMNTEWQNIRRVKGVEEYFWLGKFIQSDEWQEPPGFNRDDYPYLKDGFCYDGKTYAIDNEIHATEMTHATNLECMHSIIKEGGFKSGIKHCPGVGPEDFLWFDLKIEEGQIDYMKENRKRKMYSLMQTHGVMQASSKLNVDDILNETGCSYAFQPISLFGNFKFTLEIQKVMEAYTIQFCNGADPDLRKLGTFAYKQQIMHAILVCPPNTPTTDMCPLLNAEPVIQQMLKTWIWKPHSTGVKGVKIHSRLDFYPDYPLIRWEHVSFAFFVPRGICLEIPDLKCCVSLCLGRTSLDVDTYIHMMLKSIESTDEAEMLISMIAGYLKDERLYEKTKFSWISINPVNLDPVVQRIRKILPNGFESHVWEPLTKWMNSLTGHSNVLYDIQKNNIGRWQIRNST